MWNWSPPFGSAVNTKCVLHPDRAKSTVASTITLILYVIFSWLNREANVTRRICFQQLYLQTGYTINIRLLSVKNIHTSAPKPRKIIGVNAEFQSKSNISMCPPLTVHRTIVRICLSVKAFILKQAGKRSGRPQNIVLNVFTLRLPCEPSLKF